MTISALVSCVSICVTTVLPGHRLPERLWLIDVGLLEVTPLARGSNAHTQDGLFSNAVTPQ